MEKILITGASGFFASRFAEFYKDRYNIFAMKHDDLDISNEFETIHKIKEIKPDYLIHSAAIADTNICEMNPELSYSVNVKGSVNVAKGCSLINTKLIYLSSEQVYNGNFQAGPYSEECKAIPNTVYGKHKLDAEKAIIEIKDDSLILRFTWLFGLPERHKKTSSNIVWNVVKAMMNNEKIKLPANEYRGMTYVYEVIENFQKILQLPSGLYNTGSENDLNTYEVGKEVLSNMGLKHRHIELLIKDNEKYKEKCRDLRISNEKLSILGIKFSTTEKAIAKCIKDFSYKVL